ncbi:Uncharacterised protein [Providencia rustigianii]|nr:Uncharacterised protein [Providencia rustigianii]
MLTKPKPSKKVLAKRKEKKKEEQSKKKIKVRERDKKNIGKRRTSATPPTPENSGKTE